MPTQPISLPSGDAPSAYKVSGSGPMTPLLATAEWDGSGAAGDFHPCVSFYGQDNNLLGRFGVENTITAGDSGEVTYGPFLMSGTGTGADGIAFNKDNQGGYLDVTANDPDPDGNSLKLWTTADGDFLLGWDPGAVSSNNASGDVIIGVPYSGNRAVRFRASVDTPPDYIESVTIDDFAVDLHGTTVMLNVSNIGRGSTPWAPVAGVLGIRLDTSGNKFIVYDHSANPILEITG